MPLFVLIGRDGPNGLELRKTHRPAHLSSLEPLSKTGRVRFAGPLMDSEGKARGSVIVFESSDLAAARALVDQDPYVQNGVFESVELFESMQVFPAP